MNVFLKIAVILLPLTLVGNQMQAQLITVETRIDTTAIIIGDQINYSFEVTKPSDLHVNFPKIKDTLAEGIEIIEQHKIDTLLLDEDKQKLIKSYTITSFDSGLFYIPPFDFPFTDNEIKDTIKSKAGYLEVFTVPVDMQAGIKDIKGPYKAPVTFLELLPYLLGALVLALLIIVLIKYFSRKKTKKQGILIEKPKEPAHVIAFRELELLKQKKLWQQGQVKTYYSELTQIIREYIERRFNINAMEETSEEIFSEFNKRKLDKELYFELLRQLLIKADLVKFAKDQPLPDENESYYNHAFTFVEHSKEEKKMDDKEERSDSLETVEEQKKELNG